MTATEGLRQSNFTNWRRLAQTGASSAPVGSRKSEGVEAPFRGLHTPRTGATGASSVESDLDLRRPGQIRQCSGALIRLGPGKWGRELVGFPVRSSSAVAPEAARWHAVHTNSRAEWMAHQGLRERGFETFYPHYAGTVRHGRKSIGVLKPYFVRYLFVRIRVGQSYYAVGATPGVSSIVNIGGEPLDIPDKVVADLQRMGDEDGKIELTEELNPAVFLAGDIIRFDHGPFAGLLAEVAKSVDGNENIRVWIEAFGRRTAMTLPPGASVERTTDVAPKGRSLRRAGRKTQ